jgi:hypothetical protein
MLPTKFHFVQRRRLKCEKLTDDRRQTPSDGKSSHCLWQGELKMLNRKFDSFPDFFSLSIKGVWFKKKKKPDCTDINVDCRMKSDNIKTFS